MPTWGIMYNVNEISRDLELGCIHVHAFQTSAINKRICVYLNVANSWKQDIDSETFYFVLMLL